jgi:hypothetical protein
MTATVGYVCGIIIGRATTGITEFQGRRASFPVAGSNLVVTVLFATRTSVFGSTVLLFEYICLITFGCVIVWFLHDSTCFL